MDRRRTAGRQLCGQYWRTAGAGHQRLSARHRPPGGVAAGQQQRLSIAFFLGAQLDAVVPVYTLPPELAREARGPDSDPHNPLLRDVGWNYLKGRLRSHPDVAERYYQDVFANAPSN
jgi:isopenicillin N synthase-like dioxygenase